MYHAFVSVDFGRQHDYTAVVVAEEGLWVGEVPAVDPWAGGRALQETVYWQGLDGRGWTAPSALAEGQRDYFHARGYAGHRPSRPPLLVRHIERIRGRPYTQVVAELAALLARPPLAALSTVVLADAGGVGVAVSDLLWQQGVPHVSITATGGDSVNVADAGKAIRCPKRELVAAAQICLAEGRLRIASGMAHGATLTAELADYRVSISAAGHDSYSAREGRHDDLVYAAAQLCWYRDWFCQQSCAAIAAAHRPAVARR